MLLAIDAGNTNVVFAVYEGDEQRGIWRSANEPHRTADEHAVWLMSLMALQGLQREEIKAAIIATVVPASLFNLVTLCRRYFECEPLVVGDPEVALGIRVLTEKPDEVGADRLVNAVAGFAAYGGPLVIIDFGTATTFDVIDSEGNYLGGVIAPGANLSLEALHMAAAKLPLVGIRRPEGAVVGRNTVAAMQSGIYWGYVGLIEGLVERIRSEQGDGVRVIATGGLANLFANATEVIESIDKDLTLRGLLEVHRRNSG